VENQNNTQTERDLRAISRFFNHKIPKYIFIVLDDERILNYLIVRVQIQLKKKKKEILRLRLSDTDAYAFRQVKTFLRENQCDGLMVTNLNMLIYKYGHECVDLLNKSRDAFARFHLPIVFVINTDNLKKIINGASDFYQLRELPDFHFEDSGVMDNDFLKITSREFGQIKDSDLKASLLEEQLNIVTQKQKVDKNALNNIVVPLLSIYIDKNDFKKVEELFNRHVKGKEELIRDKIVLGDCYRNLFDTGKAINFYKQALDDYKKLKDSSQILRCYWRLGNTYLEIESYDEAKSCYEKSLEIGKEIGDEWVIAFSLNQIGINYFVQGRYDDAFRQYQQSLEIFEKIEGMIGVSGCLFNIGMIYQKKGDYEVALEKYQKSMEIKKKNGDIAGVAICMIRIGLVHEDKKDYTTALRLFYQSLQIFLNIGSPHSNTAKVNIDCIREKMPKEEFETIAKEFSGLDNWIRKEPAS
jgi:tetratricopeptide (TPR) repeat protein